jgi:integrase
MYIDNTILSKILFANKDNELVYIFIKFLWHTGARLVEALDITPESISFVDKRVRIKNKRKRTRKHEYYREIVIPSDVIEDLGKFIRKNKIEKDERLFKFTSKTAIKYIHIACEVAGLEEKVTPKSFRYSFAQNQIEKDIDDFELSYLLGNTDIKKTCIYRNQSSKKYIA